MLLQSLVDYYDILSDDPDSGIPLLGYSRVNVSYALNINNEGELLNVIPLKIPDSKGKKYIPKSMVVPEQEKKTIGVKSNFLCENSSYVFGIDNKGKPDRSIKCFEAFRDLHIMILDSVNCDEAKAIVRFVKQWNVPMTIVNPALNECLDDILKGTNFVFHLDGGTDQYIHENALIKQAWEKYKNNTESQQRMKCLVTGKTSAAARLHQSVKGLKGGQAMGNSLVSFNAPAYESYAKSQGLNSPVSEYAAFAYTSVLNHLLNDNAHKLYFGDTTVVFWAESPEHSYQDCISLFFEPSDLQDSDNNTEVRYVRDQVALREVKSILEKINTGRVFKLSKDIFDENTKFFILGLSPNVARLSIRFFIKNNFGNIVNMIAKHYQELSIEKQFSRDQDFIPVWKLLSETVSPKASDKASSPLMSGSVIRSILQGTPYPMSLYNAVLNRIRADKTINYVKAAIIKAILLRNYPDKDYKEVLGMSLNEQSDNKAYILGRLFAVLEKAQEDANPNINTTIKDRYFTSACATPATVFPILLRLSNHHISKAEYGYTSENRIKTILDRLSVEDSPFPPNMSLENQGVFILGYYHQKNSFYKKVEKEN